MTPSSFLTAHFLSHRLIFRSLFVCCGLVLLLSSVQRLSAQSSNYLHTSGTKFVDRSGRTVLPSGVNLGNWFVWEPYMMGGGSSPEGIRQSFLTLAGSTNNFKAWRKAWLDNYITLADIQQIQKKGFNTVRVPLDWRDFIDANGNAINTGLYVPNAPAPTNAPVGIVYLDHLLNWCTQCGIYVMPDMHTRPDTLDLTHQSIYVSSVSDTNLYLNQVMAAWSTIAQRYQNAANMLGYDLINEAPGYIDYTLRPSNLQIRNAIRAHDTNHIIVVEGNIYADLGETIKSNGTLGIPFDSNMAVSVHQYGGDALPPASIPGDYPTASNNFNGRTYYTWNYASKEHIPLIIGETGENNNNWVNALKQLWNVGYQGVNAGVLYWTYKKPGDSVRAIVSTPFTTNWSTIGNYLDNGGTVPTNALAMMMHQATNNSLTNATFHPDVVDSISRLYPSQKTKPFVSTIPTIPGTIKAANYDMGGAAPIASPTNSTIYSYYSANANTVTYQVRNDRVGTIYADGGTALGYLNNGDWQNYSVNITPGTYQVILRYTSPSTHAQVSLAMNDVPLFTSGILSSTGGWNNYQPFVLGQVTLTKSGLATLKITAKIAGLNYSSIQFIPVKP